MRDPVDLARLISDVVAEVESAADAKGLTIEVHSLEEAPAMVDIDDSELRRALHLALEATVTCATQGWIHVRLERADAEHGWRFTVSGAGAGTPIRECSSTFVVVMPAAESPTFDQPLSILVVDDSIQQRNLVRAYLADTPHHVTEAVDGTEAIATVKCMAFDVVIMDLQMPGVDGLAATRAIREFESSSGRPRVPILALTALGASDDVTEAGEAGADDCLVKPVTRSALFRALMALPQPSTDQGSTGAIVSEPVADAVPDLEAADAMEAATPLPERSEADLASISHLPPAQLLAWARHQVTTILSSSPQTQASGLRRVAERLTPAATASGLTDIAHLSAALERAATDGSPREAQTAARTLLAWLALPAG